MAGARREVVVQLVSFEPDLLLKEGVADDCRGPGVFHALDVVEVFAKR